MKHIIKAIAVTIIMVIVNVIVAVAYVTIVVFQHSGYLSPPLRPRFSASEPSERPFKQPPDFQQSKRLQNVLQQIQSHITESTSTCEHYASVCKRIDAMLSDRDARARLSEGDVKDHFKSNWPAFKPLHPSHMRFKDEVCWGRTDKSAEAPNEVELNPDLVRALEAAPEDSDLLIYLTVILMAVIFHELMHHLTKTKYAFRVTPPGSGGYNAVFGESGEDLEILLLGGTATALWKTEDLGDMEKIRRLLLVYHGHERILSVESCHVIINSLTTPEFGTIPIESLITYVQEKGIERGRFINKEYRTPSYQAPPGMVIAGRTCVRGLGIQDL